MRDVVPIYHWAGAGNAIADVLRQLGDPDAVACGRCGEGLMAVAVNETILVLAEAENLVCHFLRYAQRRVAQATRQWFRVT